MIYNCCNERRKAAVLGTPSLNGIDYLEVLDHDAIALSSPRQQTLLLHCLHQAPATLTPRNILITGGESILGITAGWVSPASTPPPLASPAEQAYFAALPNAAQVVVIRVSKAGDFSTYTLRLVNDKTQAQEDPFDVSEVLAGFDPQLSEVEFSFKVECGPEFDCKPQSQVCPPDLPTPPPINYLAKDYGSFRTVMLDRLNQLVPGWAATSEADLGIALVELIAYVGDHLSYQQDAVATEAYLETARSRISLRRHAGLVDYQVHDGCNARTWVRLQVAAEVLLDRKTTRFYTYAPGMPDNLRVGAGNEEAALIAGVKVFEPTQDAVLEPEHNQFSFYTWGDTDCCLPRGATEATLYGTYPKLQPGDVLIFQERVGPQTGNAADADIRHRCAVRLTQVTTRNGRGQRLVDPLFEDQTGQPIVSPAIQIPTPVTGIQWSQEDALPFAMCLSSTVTDSSGEEQHVKDVSVAFGNVVLADHGLSFTGVSLGTVPSPSLFVPPSAAAGRCVPAARAPVPVRFRPAVPDSPLTQAVPLPLAGSPVTPGVVLLGASGFVSLLDANGSTSLLVQATDPFQWPGHFGVTATVNTADPANFDLAVVYNPADGGHGAPLPVVLERLTGLSVNPADANYVATRINAASKLIRVPASYVPPAGPPAGFPSAPTRLPNSGSVDLLDSGAAPYLAIEATNPATWPPLFGVLAQGNQQDQDLFNLVVVYSPFSGGVNVSLPVVIELFADVSLATVSAQFQANSELIAAISFAEAPNPNLSATSLLSPDASKAVPVISLVGTLKGMTTHWIAQQTLLEQGESDAAFVVEVEADGVATLRFGDNINGKRPGSGTAFVASYRIGNGSDGNVGAESLTFLASADARIQACTNPLPAAGGTNPETNDQIRRRAPQAFMTQERAVTMADYEAVAERNPQVEQAVATLRWTGSWYTVFIATEPRGGGNLSPALANAIKRNMERYRLAGQDLQLQPPQYVSLEIALAVCVDPNYFQRDVEQGLIAVLGTGVLPNGQKGLFYPDNFTFGQTVYLSPIYQAARSVAGVVSVVATKFQPQGVDTNLYLSLGELKLGGFQVARLQNDPNFPDHGTLTLVMTGGK